MDIQENLNVTIQKDEARFDGTLVGPSAAKFAKEGGVGTPGDRESNQSVVDQMASIHDSVYKNGQKFVTGAPAE